MRNKKLRVLRSVVLSIKVLLSSRSEIITRVRIVRYLPTVWNTLYITCNRCRYTKDLRSTLCLTAYLRNIGLDADDVIAVAGEASDDSAPAAAAAAAATQPLFTDDDSAAPEPT